MELLLAPTCTDAAELALAAGWIAGNILSARGARITHDGDAPIDPRIVGVRAVDLGGLLAAISTVPALVEQETIAPRWRHALRALGVPLLDRPVTRALAEDASVAVVVPSRRLRAGATSCGLHVEACADGYRVRIVSTRPART